MEFSSIDFNEIKLGRKNAFAFDHLTEHRTYKLSDDQPIHPDFKAEMEKLQKHLAGAFHSDSTEDYIVTGIRIKEKDDGLYVIILGMVETPEGQTININSGMVSCIGEIMTITENIKQEAYSYLYEGKSAQLKMDMEVDDPSLLKDTEKQHGEAGDQMRQMAKKLEDQEYPVKPGEAYPDTQVRTEQEEISDTDQADDDGKADIDHSRITGTIVDSPPSEPDDDIISEKYIQGHDPVDDVKDYTKEELEMDNEH